MERRSRTGISPSVWAARGSPGFFPPALLWWALGVGGWVGGSGDRHAAGKGLGCFLGGWGGDGEMEGFLQGRGGDSMASNRRDSFLPPPPRTPGTLLGRCVPPGANEKGLGSGFKTWRLRFRPASYKLRGVGKRSHTEEVYCLPAPLFPRGLPGGDSWKLAGLPGRSRRTLDL